LDDRDLDTAFPDRGKHKGIASLRYDILKLFIAPRRHQYRACNSCSPMSSRCSAERLRVCRDTAPAAQRRAATTLISLGVLPLTLSSVDTAPYGLGLPPSSSALGRLRNRTLNILVQQVILRAIRQAADQLLADLGLGPLVCSLSTCTGWTMHRPVRGSGV